jgi:hypothetical protein
MSWTSNWMPQLLLHPTLSDRWSQLAISETSTTIMSSAPSLFSPAKIVGNTVICTPQSWLTLKTLVEHAYNVILHAICEGTLKPGQRLTQNGVSNQLKPSGRGKGASKLSPFLYSSDRDRGRCDGRCHGPHRGRAFHGPDKRVFRSFGRFGQGCRCSPTRKPRPQGPVQTLE